MKKIFNQGKIAILATRIVFLPTLLPVISPVRRTLLAVKIVFPDKI